MIRVLNVCVCVWGYRRMSRRLERDTKLHALGKQLLLLLLLLLALAWIVTFSNDAGSPGHNCSPLLCIIRYSSINNQAQHKNKKREKRLR